MNDLFNDLSEEDLELWRDGVKEFADKGGFASMVKAKGAPGVLDLNVLLPTFEQIAKFDRHIEYTVQGAIPQESITLIPGRGGLGKSWLAQQLGNCIAEGQPFCGLPTKKSLVYFVDYENSLSMLCDRARILGPSSMRLWHISNDVQPPRFDSPDWILFKSLFPGVLIIDTLRSCQLGDENSSKDMAMVMGRFKELRELGFTIILLHHTQKADARIYKGSTAILDLCDHVLGLEKVKDVGSDQVVDDDESHLPFRLGTREKTRFEPFAMYLKFDATKGFSTAVNPEIEILDQMRQCLLEFFKTHNAPTQKEFVVLIKKELELAKGKATRLINKGDGNRWTSIIDRKKNNQKTYTPVYYEGE